MTKSKIFSVIGALVLFVLAIVISINAKAPSYTGGSFNPVRVDFAEGISVDGTTVIDGTGSFVSAISATTGAFSGAITGLKNFITPSADVTLTAAQSGSVIKMAVAGLDVTTPAATAGLSYRFVVTAAVATTNMTIVAGTADSIEGSLIVAGAVVDCDAADVITFVIDGENIGDFVDLYSDGTSWLIGASGTLTASKMTCSG